MYCWLLLQIGLSSRNTFIVAKKRPVLITSNKVKTRLKCIRIMKTNRLHFTIRAYVDELNHHILDQ